MRGHRGSIPALLALGMTCAAASGDDTLFRDRVAPIFETHCVRCHGSKTAKGGLALDSAEGLTRGGEAGAAVTPGKPAESLLLEMVAGDAPEMPKAGKPLTSAEVASIRQWVESGAHWPSGLRLRNPAASAAPWWAIQPLRRAAVPAVCDANRPRTAIDRFILARLEKEGLKPNPEADRRTLIRRLTFDLHGLPPSWEQVEAFVADPGPDA